MEHTPTYTQLFNAAFTHPAIDNHAHPLLRAEHRNNQDIPFEGLISEATGDALVKDGIHTLAFFRATSQLAKLYELKGASWEDIKSKRAELDYTELCKKCFDPTGIQCILIDDGLGVKEIAEDYTWHDQFTHSRTRRIVRIESVAEDILKGLLAPIDAPGLCDSLNIFKEFSQKLFDVLATSAADNEVVGFKSVICYRTGLDISARDLSLRVVVSEYPDDVRRIVWVYFDEYQKTGRVRLNHKLFNDFVVQLAVEIAGTYSKPIQFHTGLGDNDLRLLTSSPAHLQPIIERHPHTTFVLLHSSYPYTREAGYLTSLYSNVYLDFGEVFPFVSGQGQRSIIRQMLELSPTNKVMWSTDGHWWPESYYLGTIQARQALYEVLCETVRSQELTEAQAVEIVEKALFHNANRVYNLRLEPHRQ